MPCYTPPHAQCSHEDNKREATLCDVLSAVERLDRENKRILENLQDQLNYYKKQSDIAIKHLCSTLIVLEQLNAIFPPEIEEWWAKHKEWDKKRK